MARSRNNAEIIKLLLKYGAKETGQNINPKMIRQLGMDTGE
jgi:hypothetical protein